ncbi:hypothetical protein ACFC0D_01020 [Streptomyces sp. NPDC056222]|uniref:hypothetical protein n=1 Tax=Streptomyces sp. NPDC056222 TaxID=3345749 RepID=UPI0035DEE1F6
MKTRALLGAVTLTALPLILAVPAHADEPNHLSDTANAVNDLAGEVAGSEALGVRDVATTLAGQ